MLPKLSVFCITYNHGPFIAQAIESFLGQKTTFEFEIVIGDDASKDDTRAILQEYQKRYPDKIRVLLFEKNRGAIYNFVDVYHECKGEYLAICEGDDYWLDPLKLQKQVDFMESHTDYSMCFHNARVEYFDHSAPSYLLNNKDQKPVITLNDIIGDRETWFIATASIVLRKGVLPRLPAWLVQSKSGDIPLHVLLLRQGPAGYIDEVMSVYRKHNGGQSNTDHRWEAHFLFNRINMYEHLDRETGYQYTDRFKRTMAEFYWLLPDTVEYQDRFWSRLFYTMKAVKFDPEAYKMPFKKMMKEKVLTARQLNFTRRLRGLK
ncbi:MAG: glycosyltransferase [Siphonobacter sp.]